MERLLFFPLMTFSPVKILLLKVNLHDSCKSNIGIWVDMLCFGPSAVTQVELTDTAA